MPEVAPVARRRVIYNATTHTCVVDGQFYFTNEFLRDAGVPEDLHELESRLGQQLFCDELAVLECLQRTPPLNGVWRLLVVSSMGFTPLRDGAVSAQLLEDDSPRTVYDDDEGVRFSFTPVVRHTLKVVWRIHAGSTAQILQDTIHLLEGGATLELGLGNALCVLSGFAYGRVSRMARFGELSTMEAEFCFTECRVTTTPERSTMPSVRIPRQPPAVQEAQSTETIELGLFWVPRLPNGGGEKIAKMLFAARDLLIQHYATATAVARAANMPRQKITLKFDFGVDADAPEIHTRIGYASAYQDEVTAMADTHPQLPFGNGAPRPVTQEQQAEIERQTVEREPYDPNLRPRRTAPAPVTTPTSN